MKRLIVRFRGSAPVADILARLSSSPAIKVIEATPRMVLVEGSEDELRKLVLERISGKRPKASAT